MNSILTPSAKDPNRKDELARQKEERKEKEGKK